MEGPVPKGTLNDFLGLGNTVVELRLKYPPAGNNFRIKVEIFSCLFSVHSPACIYRNAFTAIAEPIV
jgi:hypothetical protein